jgi:predicted dehydrogenase
MAWDFDPPASASGVARIIGVHHHTQLCYILDLIDSKSSDLAGKEEVKL